MLVDVASTHSFSIESRQAWSAHRISVWMIILLQQQACAGKAQSTLHERLVYMYDINRRQEVGTDMNFKSQWIPSKNERDDEMKMPRLGRDDNFLQTIQSVVKTTAG